MRGADIKHRSDNKGYRCKRGLDPRTCMNAPDSIDVLSRKAPFAPISLVDAPPFANNMLLHRWISDSDDNGTLIADTCEFLSKQQPVTDTGELVRIAADAIKCAASPGASSRTGRAGTG